MKSDKQKLFEAFEKVCKVKLIKESEDNIIEEGWKGWAVALGLAASSLLTTNVAAQSSVKDKIENIKNKVQSKISKDPVLKNLEKEGYSPEIGSTIKPDVILVDSGFESFSNTKIAARADLIQKLSSEGIKDLSAHKGIFVYRNEGSNVRMKWITYN